MDLSYACERFYRAMRSLVSEGKLKYRLAAAFENLSTLTHNDFPEENKLRERFSELLRKLATFDREGPLSIAEIEAESKGIDLVEAESVAEEVLSLFNDLALRDPSHRYHVASDIDLLSHFTKTGQETSPEKPRPRYDFTKLTDEESQQLQKLMQKARQT
jgi:hypothetical protein